MNSGASCVMNCFFVCCREIVSYLYLEFNVQFRKVRNFGIDRKRFVGFSGFYEAFTEMEEKVKCVA